MPTTKNYVKRPWINNVSTLGPTNFNRMENGIEDTSIKFLLEANNIPGTTKTPTYTGNDITRIDHMDGAMLVRRDDFTFTATKITEVRTLHMYNESQVETGTIVKTIENNFDASGKYTGEVTT